MSWVVSLPEEATVSSGADGEFVIHGPVTRLVLRGLPASTREVLQRLAGPGDSLGELVAAVQRSQVPGALARFFYYVRYLAERGFLLFSVVADDRPLATLVPTALSFELASREVSKDAWVLSRFAYLHRVGQQTVLESPLSAARVVVHDHRVAAMTSVLATPANVAEIGSRVPNLSPDVTNQLVGLLLAAGMLTVVDDAGTPAEDRVPSLQSWEFHDLLFHARSREGRHDGLVGETYPLAGKLEPLPAVKSPSKAETIELYRPDPDQMSDGDPPLARVVEQRASVRDYAAEPMTARQLGEILYRVARVRTRADLEMDTPGGLMRMETTSRPYPAGGGLYELEFYPVVRACRDLAPGLYHYDPLNHRLQRFSQLTTDVEQLLDGASLATGIPSDSIQVLLILSARFQRVAWKYTTLAYSLMLKHVGVVYQNLYLAATAMDLAPCAVGVGDSDRFARVIGSDYYAETSVGEFLLGSKR
jgi:SagB-type dehydrogenase family enzyme